MRALVTGAAGFVGANLVRRLQADGHDVVAVHRPGGDPWRLHGVAGATPLDLADTAAVRALVVERRPEWVFHLAAHGAYSWQQDLRAMLAVNVACTQALLEGAREVGGTVVHAGSSSEYGLKDHPPREDEALEPNSHYAVTKAAATHLCRLAARQHGQRAATLRLYSVFGPWEEPGRLLPTLVQRAMAGEWPPLVAPQTARDFVWVDDVSDALVRAAERPDVPPDAVLNIGSGRQTTLGELVDMTRDVLGVQAEPQWGSMPGRRWDTDVWVADPRAAERVLGWRASTPVADGLRAMRDWLQAHPVEAARYAPDAA